MYFYFQSYVFSQEHWNIETHTYINIKDNLQWILPNEYGEWYIVEDYRRPKYMLFAASQRDVGVAVTLIKDTIPLKANDNDPWKHGNEFLKEILKSRIERDKVFPGNTVEKPIVENCYFLNKKALKFSLSFSTVDDRYGNEPIDFYCTGYCFAKNGFTYVAYAMVLSEVQEIIQKEYGLDFCKSIFSGFTYVNATLEKE